jgi:hypothetical protein
LSQKTLIYFKPSGWRRTLKYMDSVYTVHPSQWAVQPFSYTAPWTVRLFILAEPRLYKYIHISYQTKSY